jgi:hypothetical protein
MLPFRPLSRLPLKPRRRLPKKKERERSKIKREKLTNKLSKCQTSTEISKRL